ncbi:class E sortase [Streptomyces sp. NBC_00846]|uniref:class E sortase n=1 Tax=Streptomyces sp. NBC_00846 TaxID=2975849 RepID=UPI0038633C37|nr:class E sortase [Streptomyces sp. NBC_00846]
MTALRPEHDAGQDGPYEQGAYEAAGAFEAAVDQLADPLNDPLPGQHASQWSRSDGIPSEEPGRGLHRAPDQPSLAQPQRLPHSQAPQGAQTPEQTPREWYDPEGFERDWYGQQAPAQVPRAQPAPVPLPPDDETVGLRTADARHLADQALTVRQPVFVPEPEPVSVSEPVSEPGLGSESGAGPEKADPEPRTGGRAERRRAAKGRGRRRAEPRPESAASAPASVSAAKPMSRVEARRAARAAKDSPAVVASRVVGELFISLGVLMLLFVTYQLWWTNVRADQYAGKETHKIQDDWAKGDRNPGAFEAGQGFAIIHIPKLDVVAPIAEGISKEKVLDRGMVGHYSEGTLRTAMPSAKKGNFALAGHRNTHGEPFRYINRLRPGDLIVVETQDAYYTYEATRTLPQTSPSNVSVIGPVPPGSGFTGPGRYVTLTTCTPEFTSTYRLIVWGKMVDERPRSKGKPDALVG